MVAVNRVQLALFSAPLESSRSPEVNSPTSLLPFAAADALKGPGLTGPGEPGRKEVINLYINERRVGDVTVLDLKGRVRIGGSTIALHKAIRCLVGEDKTRILLNLADVTHIDSSGLGELIASHITLSDKGGEVKLVHLTERLRELMTITKLLTVFDVYDDEPAALASFAGEVLKPGGPALVPCEKWA
jgi:anti-sigma B factor antagonist